MGGRGSYSSTGSSAVKIASLQGEFDQLAQRNEYLVRENRDSGAPPREYYSNQKKMQQIRSQISELESKEIEKKNRGKKSAPKTFVNSFGEATKREITSSTYERAQKRQNKRIVSLIGGR